ncbi:hypothetical protein F0562_015661 [Nyssa sinensis]|uniref:Polygalacturonase n=1 Tax=Nyssa sinensis TaxID=561372 RepID=A0A5J4ZLN9_9ASTE|nr:hypothetical protein F0562_015661 [Nyssa sinensis]
MDRPRHYLQEDSAYDFQAYPSYFSFKDMEFEDSMDIASTMPMLRKPFEVRKLAAASVKTVNVDDFGAKGDGRTDDTEVYGTIAASGDRSVYNKDRKHWIIFDSVQNLNVEGGGIINGNGKIWWQNSCKINKALALTFYECKNLIVKNLKIQNAQQIHVSFENCENVQASGLTVTAPENSPNTDGIHVTGTQNIHISSSVIGTGDDCISIVSGSQKVQATDITCGPGHGISIGSLGSGNSAAYVSDVTVTGAKLSGTTNGVRIKTWPGGSGSASNIKFQNVEMNNVANPIIIDQNYCDEADGPCTEQKSAVQVKNVVYQNIKGTSAGDVAIKFDCSKNFPCQGIVLQDVNIKQGGAMDKRRKTIEVSKELHGGLIWFY